MCFQLKTIAPPTLDLDAPGADEFIRAAAISSTGHGRSAASTQNEGVLVLRKGNGHETRNFFRIEPDRLRRLRAGLMAAELSALRHWRCFLAVATGAAHPAPGLRPSAALAPPIGDYVRIASYLQTASVHSRWPTPDDSDPAQRKRAGLVVENLMSERFESLPLPKTTKERRDATLVAVWLRQVTTEGLPVLFVRNLPPETIPDLKIDEPSLYFGELSNDYVIVRTRTPEFHYPRGDDNETTRYSGKGGVPLGTLWRKLIFALRFGSYQILLSDDIGPESQILFNRNIRERVEKIAPFLALDRDPYLVLAEGRLYWLFDAYTTSNRYPYSTPAGPINYIRNSVKFVIDAYDGTTTAYLSDSNDPIAATFGRIFPNTFKPLSDMPASIREHVRYPEDIFAIQSQVYSTYHMTQPAVYYNREDQWEIPSVDDGAERNVMQPYYTIMRLPGEKEAEFIQMLPFTPRRRDNLAAWLVARSDGEHYGRLRVFEFPKQKLVFGPRQVVARIAQDQVISPQITLWNQQGSQVIWGTLMVIPIEESLIYVRPLYLRASGGRIPELTRVIVAYENRIVMEETLEEGLARLFSTGGAARPSPPPAETRAPGTPAPTAPPPTASGDAGLASLAAEAQRHYERAVQAQKAGDWATYGEELRQLGQVLDRMRQK